MKRILIVITIFFALTSFTTKENETKLSYFEGTYSDLQSKAKLENKPYFIKFFTNWCAPCKKMDKETFTDISLVTYIDYNYKAFAVDGESLLGDGIEIAQKYGILFYPTIIIFDPNGNELKRLVGYQNASEMKAALQKYQFESVPTPAPGTFTTIPAPQPENGSEIPATTDPQSQGLFKISLSPQESHGYGVQLGVFADYENVLKEVQKLDASYHRNVLININKLDGKTVFKIILGPFPQESQARTYLKSLKEKENREGLPRQP